MADALSTFIVETVKQWQTDRDKLTKKWESNREGFLCDNSNHWKDASAAEWESQTFIGRVRQKVLQGFALLQDLLLQGGKIPFMYQASQLESIRANPETVELATKLTEQELYDCKADRVAIRHILSLGIYGRTYAKFRIHKVRRVHSEQMQVPGIADVSMMADVPLIKVEEWVDSPQWSYVPVWEVFYDMMNGDPREGDGEAHVRALTAYQVREMLAGAGVDKATIKEVLAKPLNADADRWKGLSPSARELYARRKLYQAIEYWGRAPRTKVEAYEGAPEVSDGTPAAPANSADILAGDDVEVMALLIEGRCVRMERTEQRDRPIYSCVWDTGDDAEDFRGIVDNGEPGQRMLNVAIRLMETNKKLSANLILAVKWRFIINREECKRLRPGMMMQLDEDCPDIRAAVQPLVIPDVGASLLEVIALADRYIDEDTMLPKIAQGFSEQKDATAYQIAQQLGQAGKYIAAAVRNFDEQLIEPMITRFHEWNEDDPALMGMGQLTVKALGFTSYLNRMEKMARLERWLAAVLQHPEMASWARWREILSELTAAADMDEDEAMLSEEERQAEQEREAQMAAMASGGGGQQGGGLQDELVRAEIDHKRAAASKAKAEGEAKLAALELKAQQGMA